MLAERRTKRKWTLNPCRRSLWNRDDSIGLKFGKGLMEKMGWSEGKGLGINEQGIKQPLKVDFKNDTKGMGFKDDDDKWIQHQNHFNQLLNELTIANSAFDKTEAHRNKKKNKIKKQEKIGSLEGKSQNSKARIHYYKFTRAKDVSTYSEKDLECILGKNRENSLAYESNKEEDKYLNDEKEFELKTVNAGSMVDYFSQKMKIKKFSNINYSYMEKNSSPLKKEKILKTCDLNCSKNCEGESENLLETETEVHKSTKISRKRKKNKLKFTDDIKDENSEIDSSKEVNIEEEKFNLNDVNEYIETGESEVINQSKKSKGKETEILYDKLSKKRKLTENDQNENIENKNISKKSKKKKKHNDTENEEIIYKEKKVEDRKATNEEKGVLSNCEMETVKKSTPNIERNAVKVNCEVNINDDFDLQVPVKKKKNKNKRRDSEVKVASLDEVKEESSDVINSEDSDLKRKKRKGNDQILDIPSEVEPCKKEKKKKTEKILKDAEKTSNIHKNGITYRKKQFNSSRIPLKYKSYKVKTNQFVGSNLTSLAGYGTIKYIKHI